MHRGASEMPADGMPTDGIRMSGCTKVQPYKRYESGERLLFGVIVKKRLKKRSENHETQQMAKVWMGDGGSASPLCLVHAGWGSG